VPRADEPAPGTVELVEDGSSLSTHRGGEPTVDLAFVDGVRRVEATLYVDRDGILAHGIAASHACGAVLVHRNNRAEYGDIRVSRLAIFGSGLVAALPPTEGFAWEGRSVPSEDPEAPMNDLQTRMRRAEGELAESLAATGRLVVVDGPLHFVRERDLPVVGYIKTHHRVLLPPKAHRRVPELQACERTSLFRLGTDRFSCYLRLARPSRDAGPWSGIVRLELPASVGLAAARSTADAISCSLPRYAGVPWRDPRAPQNLQPIGALERELRHRLGDIGLAVRAVRAAVRRASEVRESVT
jgi:hypothetical protein